MKTYHVAGISHQAAIASVTRSILEPVASVEANITGTTNLFDIAAENRCRRIVFASSCAVYGNGPESPKQEGQPLDPRSPYAVTKAAKEMLARAFCDLHTIEIVGLRYFNVYGRRQNPASDYAAVIPAFITRALRNEPLFVEGDGLQTRDFVYVDDVVQANLRGLAGRNLSGCFNVGTGTNISILELARLVISTAGSTSAVVHGPSRAGDVRDSRADIGRACKELGYAPGYALTRGLAETIAWYRGQEKKKPPVPATGPGEPLQAA
jgi:nucleoside-diphosphate-sugar epimerase